MAAQALEIVVGVVHQKGVARNLQHFQVIVVVSEGHDLSGRQVFAPHQPGERPPLGTVVVDDIHEHVIAVRITGFQDCRALSELFDQPAFALLKWGDGVGKQHLDDGCAGQGVVQALDFYGVVLVSDQVF